VPSIGTARRWSFNPGLSHDVGQGTMIPSSGFLRVGACALLVVAPIGCEEPDVSDGGLAALRNYKAVASLEDRGDELSPSTRTLKLTLYGGDAAKTHAGCASLRGATLRFNGAPVIPKNQGGWHAGSVRTVGFKELAWSECASDLFIDVDFINPTGDPQNGTLTIDGPDDDFSIGFSQTIGSPELKVTSVRHDGLAVSARSFPAPPLTGERFFASLESRSRRPAPPIEQMGFANDQLNLSVRTGGSYEDVGSAPVRLEVGVHLGLGAIDGCVGFSSCAPTTPSVFVRKFDVVIPGP
jgi:hypothetical protein